MELEGLMGSNNSDESRGIKGLTAGPVVQFPALAAVWIKASVK